MSHLDFIKDLTLETTRNQIGIKLIFLVIDNYIHIKFDGEILPIIDKKNSKVTWYNFYLSMYEQPEKRDLIMNSLNQ